MTRTLTLSLGLSMLAHAQQLAGKQTAVDRIFAGFNTHSPGCAVGVAQHGAPVFQAGYGMADLERHVPIGPETIFESGSVAKQFTAMALMLLAQQGKISLDDPMRKYLPELPDYGAALTIRHVLSHVSGLREWRPIATYGGATEGTYVYTNQDLLKMAARQHALNFDPGTHYSYTNTGFNISTILIERALANGKTFPEFTHEFIFAPLGMTSTRWRDNFREIVPNRALAYGLTEGKGLEQQTPIEDIIGAGGLLTNIHDLLLWNENFTHMKVGGPEVVKTQQTQAILKEGKVISYAAGLRVDTMDGLREISHSGATGGYRTWLGRFPGQELSVVVLCNSAQANPTKLGQDTARLWTGTKLEPPKATYQADAQKLHALTGLYRKLRDNTVTEVRWKDGKLVLAARAGTSTSELLPISENEFAGPGGTRYDFQATTPMRMRSVNEDDEVLFERVDRVEPSAADLMSLIGTYDSRETGAIVTIEAGSKSGELSMRVAANSPVRLRPVFRDAFATPTGSSIYFVRDGAGQVVALSAGEDRVWDLRLTRIR